MRLTTFTDYGMRMLMRMASAPDRVFTTAELANEFGLSRNHLTKILQHLSHAGVVTTVRGTGGGASLAVAPEEVRLGYLVGLLEDRQALVECFQKDGGNCPIDGCCQLKGRLRSAESAFLAVLDQSTLADIALPAPTAA